MRPSRSASPVTSPSLIFHCTPPPGGLCSSELSSDCTSGLTLWTRGEAESQRALSRGCYTARVQAPIFPQSSPGELEPAHSPRQEAEAHTAGKILYSPSVGFSTCKKERWNGNADLRFTVSFCVLSLLSLLSQPFYGCFQFLRP